MQQITGSQNLTNELHNRVRLLEGRYNATRDRMFLINDTLITHFKNIREELDSLDEEIKDVKGNIEALKQTSANLLKELDLFARKENVKVLEKYINMWNPLNFVTEQEVIELIEKKRTKNAPRHTKKKRKRTAR